VCVCGCVGREEFDYDYIHVCACGLYDSVIVGTRNMKTRI
jgi:hypothetical protein